MCGIAGVINLTRDEPIPNPSKLLVHLSIRGRDATGIGYWRGNDWFTVKAGCEAKQFVEIPNIQGYLEEARQSSVVFLHCRAATHGSPKHDKNNHPIFNNKGVLIHNGIVYLSEKLKAIGETDSEQLLLTIQKYGIRKAVESASGSLTIAYIDFENPDYVWLYCKGMPLTVVKNKKRIWFCSTLQILFNGMPKKTLTGKAVTLKEGSLWKINTITGEIERSSHAKAITKERWSSYPVITRTSVRQGHFDDVELEEDDCFETQRVFGLHSY